VQKTAGRRFRGCNSSRDIVSFLINRVILSKTMSHLYLLRYSCCSFVSGPPISKDDGY
jgi:hypothetical protein